MWTGKIKNRYKSIYKPIKKGGFRRPLDVNKNNQLQDNQ